MTTSTTHPSTFSQWVRRLRTQGDLTQEALAELAFCSVQAIRAFETGKRRPSLEMAERLAAVLGVPAEQREAFIRLARTALPAEIDEDPPTPPAVTTPITRIVPFQPRPLPSAATPLIGREGESNILRQLILVEKHRLVTLVGVGGMGKTRLALAVATTIGAQFADGVVFVPVAPLRAAAHLPGAIADALQLPLGSGDPTAQVLTALASRHLLLLLDGFEELLHQEPSGGAQDAVAWVNQLLQQTTQVQLLVTSRERLRLRSERPFELSGLALPSAVTPAPMADAVTLFLQRAQQSTTDFRLDSSNGVAVARICQLVDGIPLGIELAAAWVNVLSPTEIASELESNIDLLARANRDATPRHRSMRAVFDHSWALLNDEERETLGRLATFRGGCQRDAAQIVAKASLPLLAGLIDKSLVRRRQTERQARYELHEVVRQYAAEKRRTLPSSSPDSGTPTGLAQDDVWLAHYHYFYKLAATARPHLYDREQLQWLQVLDEEHANLRAALDRALTTKDMVRGLQLAIQLEEYWYIRGHHREGLQRLLDFLAAGQAALTEQDIANGYVAATILAIAGGNYSAAQGYIERAIILVRQMGDQAVLAKVLRYWGLVALHKGDYAAAETHATEALQLALTVNNTSDAATTLTHLAEIALIQQNYGRAQELGEQAVQMLRRIEDKNQLAGSLRRLAQVRIQQGQWTAAKQEARESLALNNELGDQRGIAASLVMVAALPAAQEAWSSVAQLLGAASYLLAQAQSSLLPADQLVYDDLRQRAATHLPTFPTHYETGHIQMAQQARAPYDLRWIDQLL